jgi:hypothetical protein
LAKVPRYASPSFSPPLSARAHEISRNTAQQPDAFRLYGHDDLSDRLDLLVALYHHNDQLDKAIAMLQQSRHLCAKQGIAFDGDDLLRQYMEESKSQQSGNEMPSLTPDRQEK